MTDSDIDRIAALVLRARLPHDEWTHEAHFAFALWCFRYRLDLTEPEAIRAVIMRLNDFNRTPNTDTSGYHHTITLASMRAAASLHDPAKPLSRILADLMASRLGKFAWIFDHWSEDHLFSVDARHGWTEPDVAPLPF